MVYREHLIEIWVNGQKLELKGQKSVSLRFQNVLFNPEKIASTQAEYSFEFEIPSTPHNDQIFDYANNLSKLNKFHQRWNAEVYADGTLVFQGSMTLNSYKNKMYKVNLVSVKTYSLEDIFGEMTMNEIKNWEIEFNGVETINRINALQNTDVVFPLVCYGAFQKDPKFKDSVGSDYTSKFEFDQYNRWWIESFYPSHNMLATLKKAFESKNYVVGGDAFQDEKLKDIYMSVNLADEQSPSYNVGNPYFGKISLNIGLITQDGGVKQDLDFPYDRVTAWGNASGTSNPSEYNFKSVNVYNVLQEGNVQVVSPQKSYMYNPNENLVVIPADGFYRINLTTRTELQTSTISAATYQWARPATDLEYTNKTLTSSLKHNTPFELQLIKVTDDELKVELIKGKDNLMYVDGNPNNIVARGTTMSNVREYTMCYPHEDPLQDCTLPTEKNELPIKSICETFNDSPFVNVNGTKIGYYNGDNEVMAYDPVVNSNFVCGLSSLENGTSSVIKNGYSWSKSVSEKYESMYPQAGYFTFGVSSDYYTYNQRTSHNYNIYQDCPSSANYVNVSENMFNGSVSCMVYLKKNDILALVAIQRTYETEEHDDVNYSTSSDITLEIEAITPQHYDNIVKKNTTWTSDIGYSTSTQFSDKLNLANFFNKEKKVSEWVQNIVDAYNLDIIQNGNSITINVRKQFDKYKMYAVDIDDRTNSNNAESSMINYPKSMSVKYKIDQDEWGAENSVVEVYGEEKMNDDDWKDFIDSGFTTIQLNDDSYVTSTSDKNLQFSYTWYDSFDWFEVDYNGQLNPNNVMNLRLPVISKFTYMMPNYNYEESMKHDGYGLTQRFWFKPTNHSYDDGGTTEYAHVWTESYPKEKIYLYTPSNLYKDGSMYLSYKTTEPSILTKYFNISSYLASNYVEVEVYLAPEEYNMLKNGCMVRFDSDLYYTVEIQGYDCSGYNAATLKLLKKVV